MVLGKNRRKDKDAAILSLVARRQKESDARTREEIAEPRTVSHEDAGVGDCLEAIAEVVREKIGV